MILNSRVLCHRKLVKDRVALRGHETRLASSQVLRIEVLSASLKWKSSKELTFKVDPCPALANLT